MIGHYQDCESLRLAALFKDRFREAKVLDLGCGTGRNFPIMQAAGCEITGVDANPEQAKKLEEDFPIHGTDWQPEPDSFDVLLASHVIEHMEPQDLLAFMDKWLAALKTGGALIVATPLLGERFYHDFTHVRPYYPQSLRMMFGGISTASSGTCKWRMEMEDIWFFRDPFRLRTTRSFYPGSSAPYLAKRLNSLFSRIAALAYAASGGLAGGLASWIGVYRKLEK